MTSSADVSNDKRLSPSPSSPGRDLASASAQTGPAWGRIRARRQALGRDGEEGRQEQEDEFRKNEDEQGSCCRKD